MKSLAGSQADRGWERPSAESIPHKPGGQEPEQQDLTKLHSPHHFLLSDISLSESKGGHDARQPSYHAHQECRTIRTPRFGRSWGPNGERHTRFFDLKGIRGYPVPSRCCSCDCWSGTSIPRFKCDLIFFGQVMGLGMLATTEPPSTTTKIERKKSIKTLKSMPIKAEAKEEVSKEKPKRRSAYSVSIGSKMPDEVQVFVEVSKGSRNKYEWDDALGHIVLGHTCLPL
eukprot:1360729-Amorphochlora_amoeboformis.AAC.2